MSTDPRLGQALRHWQRRLRMIDSLTWGAWGLLTGLALALMLAAGARAAPLISSPDLRVTVAVLTATTTLAGVAIAWLRPQSVQWLARTFDTRFSLAERLTTAIELQTGQLTTSSTMASAQLSDTLNSIERADQRAALPLNIPGWALIASGVALIGLALCLGLDNPQDDVLANQAAVAAAVEEALEELEATRDEVVLAEPLTEAERAALLEALEEAISALDDGEHELGEAIAALAEAETALAALQDPTAQGLERALERAAAEMSDSDLTREIAELLAQREYEEAAEALADSAAALEDQITNEEAQELAEQLAQAAEELAQADSELAELLAEAAAHIDQGEMSQASETLQQAAQQLQEAGDLVQSQELLEEALAALQESREQLSQASSGEPVAGQDPANGMPTQGEPSGQPEDQSPNAGQQTQPGHHEDAGSAAPYDDVSVPERLGEDGTPIDLDRNGEQGLPIGDTPLPAPGQGRSNVPYREVYLDYASEAYAALEGSYIPLGMKRYVRDYFSSLEP